MKIVYLRLKNYVGLLAGMGIHEVKLDLSKFTSPIILITGPNGCGKSTILKAAHPYPDNVADYVQGMTAEKEIYIDDSKNSKFYEILIRSTCNATGNRLPHKAFIKINGEELNENGNISSFKEIMENEMDLDPLFLALTSISTVSRGIADLSPADRKKYVNTMMRDLDVYNQIYKKLSKSATIYRGMINNLTTKINGIGNEGQLLARVAELSSICEANKQELDTMKNDLGFIQGNIKTIDPDGHIVDAVQNFKSLMDHSEEVVKIREAALNEKLPNTIKEDKLFTLLEETTELCNSWIDTLHVAEMNKTKRYERSSSISQQITQLDAKISALENSDGMNDPTEAILDAENKINVYESELEDMQIMPNSPVTELYLLAQRLDGMHGLLESIWSNSEYSNLYKVKDIIIEGRNIDEEVKKFAKDLEEYHSMKEAAKSMIEAANKRLDVLDTRPSECKIDTCPFLVDPKWDNYKTKQDILNMINLSEVTINRYDRKIVEINGILAKYEKCTYIFRSVSELIKWIDNSPVMDKYAMTYKFRDRETLMNILMSGSKFEQATGANVLKAVSMIEAITSLNATLEKLRLDKVAYDINVDNLETLLRERDELEKAYNEANISYTDSVNAYDQFKAASKKSANDLKRYQELIKLKMSKDQAVMEYNKQKEIYDRLVHDSEVIVENMKKAEMLRQSIMERESNYNNNKISLDNAKITLVQLNEYRKEIDGYRSKYEVIEKVRKYTSPNTGIQTVYISMYMSKTLNQANELLSKLFGGAIRFEPYIISESEFSMPMTNYGMLIDDISRCSASQIAMASMILSFVLVTQASGKYNIFKLDETDAPLDTVHRMNYPFTLMNIANILGIEQILTTSHSIESSDINVDKIMFKMDGNNDIWTVAAEDGIFNKILTS